MYYNKNTFKILNNTNISTLKMVKIEIIVLTLLNSLFSCYLNARQYFKLNEAMPEAAKKIFSQTGFSESVKYNQAKLLFGGIVGIISTFKDIAIYKYLKAMYFACFAKIKGTDATFMTFLIVTDMVFDIPFSLFKDFVIERVFGFNNKTLLVFIKDFFTTLLLSCVFAFPVFKLIFYIVFKWANFYLYAWIAVAIIQIFMVIFYPTFISPLYNKFSPLTNETLKNKIEDLAKKVGFTIDQISVMDGSKRSGHSNAYFTGFGKAKKIVFYDTILKQLSDEEALAVLCHELGHWSCSHVLFLTAMGLGQFFVYFYVFNLFIKHSSNDPISIKLVEFNLLYSCLTIPLSLAVNLVTRRFERQADAFAVSHGFGKALQNALIKLHSENKSSPVVDGLYSAVHYCHPHTLERISVIEDELKKLE